MNILADTDKFTLGLIEYLNNQDSIELEVFLIFQSHEDLDSYMEKQGKWESGEVLHQYSTIPALHVKVGREIIGDLNNEKLIQTIDINGRCYLSNSSVYETIDDSHRNSEEKTKNPFMRPVKVAFIDSGIDRNHSDLRNIPYSKIDVVVESWDDIVGHGTLIAGMVAEDVPTLEMIDVKVVGRSGLFFTSDVLHGLDLLFDESVDIVLLGFSNPTHSDGKDALSQMCAKFGEKNIIIVAPAGNFGPERDTIGFAAHLDNGFCIGSLRSNERMSFFSSKEKSAVIKPDFYVLGENITSTASFHGLIGKNHPKYASYRILSGTSVSAALFTALLANILVSFPEYSYTEILEFLSAFNPTTRKLIVEDVETKIQELRPNPVSFKKIITIASVVTAILGIFGIVSILLI